MCVRFRVPAEEILKAGTGCRGRRRSGDNAAELGLVREDGGETGEHAVRGLAHRQDTEVRKPAEVVVAAGAAKGVAGAEETAFDGGAGVDGFEGMEKDAPGQLLGV